jgi:biotin synthase
MQSMCFFAGANSIFYGEKLLTTDNPETNTDMMLFKKLGITPEKRQDFSDEAQQSALLHAIESHQDSKLFYDATQPRV